MLLCQVHSSTRYLKSRPPNMGHPNQHVHPRSRNSFHRVESYKNQNESDRSSILHLVHLSTPCSELRRAPLQVSSSSSRVRNTTFFGKTCLKAHAYKHVRNHAELLVVSSGSGRGGHGLGPQNRHPQLPHDARTVHSARYCRVRHGEGTGEPRRRRRRRREDGAQHRWEMAP